MAPAIDATSPSAVTGTTTAALVTASFTPPAGAVVCAVAVTGNSAGSVAQDGTFTDSLVSTWATKTSSNVTGNGMCAASYITTSAAGSAMTVTWTPSGTNGKGTQLKVWVLTGCLVNSVGTVANPTGLTVADIAAYTPTNANSIIIGAICYTVSGIALTGPQAGTTADLATNDATNGETYGSFHVLNASTSPQAIGWTNSGLSQLQAVALEFLPGSSTPVDKMSVNVKRANINGGVLLRPRIYAPGRAR